MRGKLTEMFLRINEEGNTYIITQWGKKRGLVMLSRELFEELAEEAGVKVTEPRGLKKSENWHRASERSVAK